MKWRSETITLSLKNERRQPCVKATVCSGLALHRAYNVSGYAVTHVASGLRVARFWSSEEARQFAEAILPLTDWTREEGFLATRVGLDERVRAEFKRVQQASAIREHVRSR